MQGWTTRGWLGLAWGIGGVILLLLFAIVRMWPIALDSWRFAETWIHYTGYGASLVFFGFVEGYKAFQKQFSPRVVARGFYLARRPRWLFVVLAPAFCMAYFHATKKRLIVSWCLTAGIIMLVIGVKMLPQPWRGMVDLGVVVALAWGIIAIVAFLFSALRSGTTSVPPEVPEVAKVPLPAG